jgi:DNA (cytosine-5)-methyltransferase 1
MKTVISLASGIGGLDLAFDRAGFEIVAQVEINEFCQRILKREWPHALRLGDIRKVTKPDLPYADGVVGGFPCQPFSTAGNRKGTDDPRNLWTDFRRLIGDLRPRFVFLENVPGILTSYVGDDGRRQRAYALRVLGDLTALGYCCEWGTLFAADAGAPHLRERWWCVAYSGSIRRIEPATWNAALDTERDDPACERTGTAVIYETVAGDKILENPEYQGLQRGQSPDKLRQQAGAVGLSSCAKTGGQPKPIMGRVFDGLSAGMDRSRWPAPQGPFQYDWEPSRTCKSGTVPNRGDRIEALGNAVVPQVVYPMAVAIREYLEQDDVS